MIGQARALALDLDQTLFDRRAAFRSMVEAGLVERGASEASRERAWRDIALADAGGYGERDELLGALARHLGWRGADLEGTFRRKLMPWVRPFPGIVSALEHLAGRMPLALLTDGSSAMQRAKIERMGVGCFFSHVQVSGEFGASKPDPAAFEGVARALDLAPAELCMVGDHRERDVDGALAAGWRAVWVTTNPEGADVPAVRSVADLTLPAPAPAEAP